MKPFTVCDNAAGEACPFVWPGRPLTTHWGIPDPAVVEGSDEERRAAFRAAFETLETRFKRFVNLPFATLDRSQLEARLREIGSTM